jgi:hypothetical protein
MIGANVNLIGPDDPKGCVVWPVLPQRQSPKICDFRTDAGGVPVTDKHKDRSCGILARVALVVGERHRRDAHRPREQARPGRAWNAAPRLVSTKRINGSEIRLRLADREHASLPVFWILDIKLLRIVPRRTIPPGALGHRCPDEAGWRDEGAYSFFHSSRWSRCKVCTARLQGYASEIRLRADAGATLRLSRSYRRPVRQSLHALATDSNARKVPTASGCGERAGGLPTGELPAR